MSASSDLDSPATRRDLVLFREDIRASLATFEAHTRDVIVGLMQDVNALREELRDAFGDAAARLSDHERRIIALEARMRLCADCPRVTSQAEPDGGHDDIGVPG